MLGRLVCVFQHCPKSLRIFISSGYIDMLEQDIVRLEDMIEKNLCESDMSMVYEDVREANHNKIIYFL